MLKGNILLSSNVDDVMKLATNHLVICISGETHNYKQMIDVIGATEASILMPPYEALVAELDGDMKLFESLYFTHLSTLKIATTFIALIVRALFDGKNVLLYLTPEESKMAYIQFFLIYFKKYLGISIGTFNGNDCAFDTNYTPVILNLMLLNDILSYQKYLKFYPEDKPLPVEVVHKLSNVMDNNLPINSTYEEYVKLFEQSRRIIKSTDKNLESPFTRG